MGGGSIPTGHGLVAGQVAEIIVTLDGESGRRGSGYRVGPGAVLTAAHVLDGAVAVRVRFDADLPDEWSTEMISYWADSCSDLAVLSIAPREGEPAVTATRFGRIGGDRAAVLAARAVGFPRFTLKADDSANVDIDRLRYRDSHQADGSVAVLPNRRKGTLELAVSPPEHDPDPEVSPWEGMSGAAMWVSDRIVGVIAKHHRCDGLGRLAATRLDLALAGLDQHRQAELRTLLGLPDVLPYVVPPSAGEWVRTAYQAYVRDIAPKRLLDREKELDELVAFCAGDQPYAWWQARPWAGKSALMSQFVLDPPAGVDVVSFFVTAWLAGQSDSDACATALIEQLAALLGRPPITSLTASARWGTVLQLLDDAASRLREVGRRLLLVIDGLDEDSGTAGRSIAARLPLRPPPEVRILVASRPDPQLPTDVHEDHPLRTVDPRQLDVSEHARGAERRAKYELTQLLAGSRLQRDVLGFITAAGGGLTLDDLEKLTDEPPYEIERLLGGLLGRSVGSRTGSPTVRYAGKRIYLFAHETLGFVAEQQYGNSLATYQDQLHTWADRYRQQGWPMDTPYYLLGSYISMLASIKDLSRLVTCATDQDRHDRMRDLTGGDTLAYTEISKAQDLILAQPDLDLISLALLAVQRDHLIDRNSKIPTELPAVWAMLGQLNRAETLANSIPRPYLRADALARVAAAAAAVGDHRCAARLRGEAEAALTTQITNPYSRVRLLVGVAQAVAVGGDHDRAEALTGQITDSYLRVDALTQVVEVVFNSGDHDEVARLVGKAEALTGQITDTDRHAAALARVAVAAATVDDHERAVRLLGEAEVLTEQITDPDQQEWAMIEVAAAVAACGDHDRAEVLAREITEPDWQCWALGRVAKAMATCGDHDRAEALIKKIGYEHQLVVALAQVAAAVAAGGDHDRAVRLADEAETFTAQIYLETRALAEVADALATIGDHDRAEVFTAQIGPSYRRWAVRGIAEIIAASGDHDPVEVLARRISESGQGMGALGDLVKAAVASDHDRAVRLIGEAEALARRITDPDSRMRALDYITEAAIVVSDYDRVVRLYDEAETRTRFPVRPGVQSPLAQVVDTMAAGGDYDRAEALARRITDPDRRAGTLARLARILVATDKETSQVPEHARSSSPLMLRARHLLAAALVAGSWIEVVATLARIDPVAVSVLADEVKRRWGLDSSSDSRYGEGSVVTEASNDRARHVFISYVREDVGIVDRLVRVLRERGVEVWLDRDGIRPGVRWAEAIREAIRNSSFFLACFSMSYALRERSYMHEELVLAVEELRKRRFDQAWFIPILLDDGEMPDIPIGPGETLRSLQLVSLRDDWDAGICKILAVVSAGDKWSI